MPKLSDGELVSICVHEIEGASGYTAGELAQERAEALDYYLGEPYGDEAEGRSQVVTREVYETVEALLPSMCRIFADAENMVEFDPVGPGDEDQAEQESDRVNHCFWKENRGFYNVYTFVKDALLSKTGNLKCWWEENDEEEREEYQHLDDWELGQLMSEDGVEREILEYEETETGHHVVFKTKKTEGKVCIDPVTPEEFGVRRDARSPYAQDLVFCYHRVRKTYSELIADGYDEDILNSIPDSDDVETEERLSRRHLDDESDVLQYGSHKSTRTYWVTECYIYVDRDDDGISELLKVTIAAGATTSTGSAVLLDVEEVDAIPFFTAPPNILTHKFYGLSVADMCMDLQRIKSTLLRQILDNTYLSNNQRIHINEHVNLDDLLTKRPGGVVRHEESTDPRANMSPEPFTPIPNQTFGLLEYLDELRKDRTGAGDDVPGLDAKSLANVNSSVAALAYDQARSRIELIARILAEVGFRPLFKRIHELLQKHQTKMEVVRLRGEWVQVLPSEWRTRKNMTVNVGIGIASRERQLVALDAVAEKQSGIIQGGGFGTLLMPHHLYNTMHDHARALGMEPSRYYQDPNELPPKPPEEPSVEQQAMMMQAQAQMGAAKAQNDRNQVEALKVQSDERIRLAELQNSQRELALKRQIEALKSDRDEMASQREMAEKQSKAMLDAEIKTRDQEIKMAESRLKDERERAKQQIDVYKAILQSGTSLTLEQIKMMDTQRSEEEEAPEQPQPDIDSLVQESVGGVVDAFRSEIGEVREKLAEIDSFKSQMGEIWARVVEQNERQSQPKPKKVERDSRGLVVAIGGMPVRRDESGRIVSVG